MWKQLRDALKSRCNTWQIEKEHGLKAFENEVTNSTRTNTVLLHELLHELMEVLVRAS